MNIFNYISSLVFANNEISVDEHIKLNFSNNVIPEIETYKTNKNKKIVIDQLKNISTKQKSFEKMNEVFVEMDKKPKKTYVILENKKPWIFVFKPQYKSQINSQINSQHKSQYNKILNKYNFSYVTDNKYKYRINQPKSRVLNHKNKLKFT